MRVRSLSNREKILLLLTLTLIWMTTIRFYILPVLPKLRGFEVSSEANIDPQSNEMAFKSITNEITLLEERLKEVESEVFSTMTVSELHIILSDMNHLCGGEFLEVDTLSLEESSQFSLRFQWQGTYSEWIRSLIFLQEIPWILDNETVLLRTLLLKEQTLLLWEFQCKVENKTRMRHEEEIIIHAEEGRNPFEIK